MKLNYKRTLLVGFAFFLICTFWQAYDTVIPKILTDRYGLSQSLSGIIMALDNILALFMLPLFGSISDRCRSKRGKRTPFIFFGTVAAVAAFMLLTVADASQLKLINKATTINDPDTLAVIYDNLGSEEILTPEGDRFTLASRYTKAEFTSIKSTVKETDFRAKTVVMAKSDGSGLITVETRYKIRIVTYDGSVFWYRDRETEKDTAIGETVTVDGKDVSLKAIFDGTGGLNRSILPMSISFFGSCVLRVCWVYFLFYPYEYFNNMFWLWMTYPISWFITAGAEFLVFFIVFRKIKVRNRESGGEAGGVSAG